jgi:hypothetical protein
MQHNMGCSSSCSGCVALAGKSIHHCSLCRASLVHHTAVRCSGMSPAS